MEETKELKKSPQVKLSKSKYEYVEYEDEDEFVIGSITAQNGKVIYAEMHSDLFGNKGELNKIKEFIKEIEKLEWIHDETQGIILKGDIKILELPLKGKKIEISENTQFDTIGTGIFVQADVPENAEILTVQTKGNQAYLYVMADAEAPKETRKFVMVATNESMPEKWLKYICSFQTQLSNFGDIWTFHVFELFD